MVRGVEQVTRSAREWGLKRPVPRRAPEQFIQLIQPVIAARPEITGRADGARGRQGDLPV
jgi:hypothetical protein